MANGNVLKQRSPGNTRRQGNDWVYRSLVTHPRTAHSNLADLDIRFQERGPVLTTGLWDF